MRGNRAAGHRSSNALAAVWFCPPRLCNGVAENGPDATVKQPAHETQRPVPMTRATYHLKIRVERHRGRPKDGLAFQAPRTGREGQRAGHNAVTAHGFGQAAAVPIDPRVLLISDGVVLPISAGQDPRDVQLAARRSHRTHLARRRVGAQSPRKVDSTRRRPPSYAHPGRDPGSWSSDDRTAGPVQPWP